MNLSDKKRNHHEHNFLEVVQLIQASRERAYQAVNTELINLYWMIGQYISTKISNAEWGDGIVPELVRNIAKVAPKCN